MASYKKLTKKSLTAEMDKCIKRMLKLIEEEGDTFAKKAEMYYQKRPELISQVKEFSRMYLSLAERYDHVSGELELRKSLPSASDLQSQASGVSETAAASTESSPSPTPSSAPAAVVHRKPSRRKPGAPRAAGFEFFLGAAKKEDDEKLESSSSSEPEPEPESDVASSKNKMENRNYEELLSRITSYEEELKVANEKLELSEETIARLKSEVKHVLEPQEQNAGTETGVSEVSVVDRIEALIKELTTTNKKLEVSEEEIGRLKLELGKNKSSPNKGNNEAADGVDRGRKIKALEEELNIRDSKLQTLGGEIEKLMLEAKKNETLVATNGSLQFQLEEKEAELESEKKQILDLQEQIGKLKDDNSQLQAAVSRLESERNEFDQLLQVASETGTKNEIEQLKADITDKISRVEELNKSQDALKAKCDTLMADRDELNAKVLALNTEVGSRDDHINQMDEHLQRLDLEHGDLMLGSEEARKVTEELESKVKELEEEVERQKVMISEGAKEKKEAIRCRRARRAGRDPCRLHRTRLAMARGELGAGVDRARRRVAAGVDGSARARLRAGGHAGNGCRAHGIWGAVVIDPPDRVAACRGCRARLRAVLCPPAA